MQLNKNLSLKILRGIDLVAMDHNLLLENSSDPYCEVWEEKSDGQKRKILRTSVQSRTLDPIWGGPMSTCFIGERSTITIEIFDYNEIMPDDPMGVISFRAYDVFAEATKKNYPNVWMPVKPVVGGSKVSGMLEVRVLHPSQNCHRPMRQSLKKTLAPGPKLGWVRKKSLEEMFQSSKMPVTCHVYDVSNDERIARINALTKVSGMGGIFHAAIEVYGMEYSFGGSRIKNQPGIFSCRPRKCPAHSYRQSFFLGDCDLSKSAVKHILKKMKPEWMANTYDLLRKNCVFFSQEFAIELGVGSIPKWTYSLANTAAIVHDRIKKQGVGRSKPYAVKPTTPKIIWDSSLDGNSILIENGKETNNTNKKKEEHTSDLQKVESIALEVQNNTLDHVMATRVQRAFRSSVKNQFVNFKVQGVKSAEGSDDNIEISLFDVSRSRSDAEAATVIPPDYKGKIKINVDEERMEETKPETEGNTEVNRVEYFRDSPRNLELNISKFKGLSTSREIFDDKLDVAVTEESHVIHPNEKQKFEVALRHNDCTPCLALIERTKDGKLIGNFDEEKSVTEILTEILVMEEERKGGKNFSEEIARREIEIEKQDEEAYSGDEDRTQQGKKDPLEGKSVTEILAEILVMEEQRKINKNSTGELATMKRIEMEVKEEATSESDKELSDCEECVLEQEKRALYEERSYHEISEISATEEKKKVGVNLIEKIAVIRRIKTEEIETVGQSCSIEMTPNVEKVASKELFENIVDPERIEVEKTENIAEKSKEAPIDKRYEMEQQEKANGKSHYIKAEAGRIEMVDEREQGKILVG